MLLENSPTHEVYLYYDVELYLPLVLYAGKYVINSTLFVLETFVYTFMLVKSKYIMILRAWYKVILCALLGSSIVEYGCILLNMIIL